MSQKTDSIGATVRHFHPTAQSDRVLVRVAATSRAAGQVSAAEYLDRAERQSQDRAIVALLLVVPGVAVAAYVLEAFLVVGGAL